MNKTYLLLGSNLGNSALKIKQAKIYIEKKIGTISRQSAMYKTAAWGNTNQPDFINQVIVVRTMLSAVDVLEKSLMIEKKMGRSRTVKNAPRIIDIDILFFNKEIIEQQELTVPHPLIQKRRFVLQPLNELSPGFTHPVFNKTIHQLLLQCTDTLNVKKF